MTPLVSGKQVPCVVVDDDVRSGSPCSTFVAPRPRVSRTFAASVPGPALSTTTV